MKKFLFLLLSAFFLTLVCLPAFAQEVSDQPGIDADAGFGSFASVIALIAVVTPFLTGIIGKFTSKGWIMQVASWIIAIGLVFTGWLAGIGFLAGLPVLTVAGYGLGAGLISNGIFDIDFVKKMLETLGLVKNKG